MGLKNENDEWGDLVFNDKTNNLIEYICYNFLKEIGLTNNEINFKSETGYVCIDYFSRFICRLDYDKLEKDFGIFIKLD